MTIVFEMASSDPSNTLKSNEKPSVTESKECKEQNVNVECVDENSKAEFSAGNYNDLECSIYQNYTASEVFVQGLAGIVNQQDVEAMIRAQKKIVLKRQMKCFPIAIRCLQLD